MYGNKWPYDEVHASKIKNNTITRFENIFELTGSGLPKQVMAAQEKVFGFEKIVLAKISANGWAIGNFTLVMEKGISFAQDRKVAVFIQLIGLLIQCKQAQTASSVIENRFRQLFENSQDAVIITDTHGTIISTNSAAS